jgi:beta-aspartyl-peptidase (threonine type)
MLLVLVALTATAPATKTPAANPRAEVQAFVQRFFKTLNAGDPTALMELYARVPEVASIDDGEVAKGWDEISKGADALLGHEGAYHAAPGVIQVVTLGDTYAIAYASATVTEKDGDQSTTTPGAFTLIVKKSPGGWTILHEHYSTKPAESPEGE